MDSTKKIALLSLGIACAALLISCTVFFRPDSGGEIKSMILAMEMKLETKNNLHLAWNELKDALRISDKPTAAEPMRALVQQSERHLGMARLTATANIQEQIDVLKKELESVTDKLRRKDTNIQKDLEGVNRQFQEILE